ALQNPNAGNDNVDEGDVGRNDSDGKDEEADVTSPDENANPDDEENSDIKDGAKKNDDDVEEVPDGGIALIATSDKSYTDKSVTLNYYIGDLGDGETVGFCPWTNAGGAITVDENLELDWKAWTNKTVYEMKSVEGNKGWYNITFTVTDTLTIDSETNECSNSLAGFNILRSNEPDKKDGEFGCDAWHYPEIYVDLLAGTVTAVKDCKGYADIAAVDGTTGEVKYENQSVTLNYYVGELADDETVGFYKWGSSITVNETTNPKLSWGGWGKPSENPVYRMNAVDGHTGWYNITLTVSEKLTIDPDTGISTSSLGGFSIFISSSTETQQIECSGYPEKYPEIYKGLLDGEITAVKGDKGYASIEDAGISLKDLEVLVVEASELKEEDYKAAGWKKFSEALTAAETVLKKDEPTDDEIEEAYENLEKAMDALIPKSVAEAEINVKPIALADDFITGADISSYWALKESGTIFKDEKGNELSDAEFFQYLHDGGTNWIRIRVWNDPYDSAGHGYGGGNNDLDKAKKMGKLATDAGMKVLIDFHYSDFWADPGKQQAPKAWASMSIDDRAEAVYQFTKNSLDELKSAGVDVGMVQVGNETTQGICGVWYASDGWAAAAKIYNAGSKAVREFDPNCLVAIHFTNPEDSGKYAGLAKNLDDQKVDYDVFASSYYPYWHGTTDNLTSVLAQVAKTYGKKVMVAETSWATTLDDQDGHDNTVRKGNNDTGQPYAFSVQGQADEIRAVVEAANNVNNVEGAAGSSIGVFYWESAWLSPYYVYDEDGSRNEELYNKNMAAWEQYGSGWAASYGGEYDPKDAGKWYGGSAVDNQAWFGFDGTALATAKVYSYIRTGATAEKAISDVVNPSVTVKAGATVEYPETVTVNFNDGTSAECPVEWNGEDKAEVDTNEPGDHTVRGIVTCEYTVSDGSTKTATKSVTLTITVEMTSVEGLANPGFEDSVEGNWVLTEADIQAKDQRSGKQAAHFYSADGTTTKVLQTVKGLEAGIYIFGGYIEGADADADAVVTIYDKGGNIKGNVMKLSCSLDGWLNWKNPEITGIVISEGDYLVVGMEVAVKAGGWGSMDDFYLYRAYEYDIRVDDQIKHGTLSCSAEKSVSGEAITVTATPDDGYILSKLTVSGRGVTGA
ncbi:MAG: glycosyl hydrolase 53 family protein, partial [Lachnospiraceae bacterium]|nr:glycosyl hydrolase 53 family protein [Lachnospiraceae bacterium]